MVAKLRTFLEQRRSEDRQVIYKFSYADIENSKFKNRTMASVKTDTGSFFLQGNSKQFDYVLKLYPEVLKLKAQNKNKKPEELIKLDDW